ncbi:MAG TPA: redoxin domain-containing protein [Hyphomonadaceae bacterium]|nr:redoxin domain-containing protein [Hyphomonadaceae bacterium]
MIPRHIALLAASALAIAAVSGCSKNPAEAASAPAAAPPVQAADNTMPAMPMTIADFNLSDQNGEMHELYKMTDAKAIVVFMEGVGCPIVQQMTPDLKDAQKAYESKGVKFLMLNANNQDTIPMIKSEADNFEIKMPILKDVGQKVSEPLGVMRTAETFVIQPGTWKILYHGAFNDRLTYGRAKAKPDHNYATDVVDALLAGKAIPTDHQMADGCIIDFPGRTAKT